MTSKRDHALRSKAFVEAAVHLLNQAQLEAIGAIGHLDSDTRAVADAMQQAERLIPLLNHLLQVTLR